MRKSTKFNELLRHVLVCMHMAFARCLASDEQIAQSLYVWQCILKACYIKFLYKRPNVY
jgi:IS5 family transposase